MQNVIYFSRFNPKMIVIMTFDDILLLHSRRSYTCIAHNTNILNSARSHEHPILGVGTDLVTIHCHYNLHYRAKLDQILVLSAWTSLHLRSQAVYTLHLCQSCPSSHHILFPIDHCDKSVKYLALIAERMFCTATSMALFL